MKKILPIIHKEVFNDYTILWVRDEGFAAKTLPGQFYQLTPQKPHTSLLRKPISVYDVCEDTIGFMIKVVGPGTTELAELEINDELDCIGPLGNMFDISNMKNVLFVTGGIGYAPLKYLNRKAFAQQTNTVWIHGGRTESDIFDADIHFTNDGSVGEKGFVTIGMEKLLKEEKFDGIFCCGPDVMMEACVKIAEKYDHKIFVSTETYMACGIGVCKGCVVAIKEGDELVYKTACKDGPIFDGSKVAWNE